MADFRQLLDFRFSIFDFRLSISCTGSPVPATSGCVQVSHVHINPVVDTLFVTSSNDCTVKVWDIRALGKKLKPLAQSVSIKYGSVSLIQCLSFTHQAWLRFTHQVWLSFTHQVWLRFTQCIVQCVPRGCDKSKLPMRSCRARWP
jgi:WD40 repeat protein